MGKFHLFLIYLLSFPKTVFFNLKMFPFKTAVHLPVFVNYKTCLSCLKGTVCLPQDIKTGIIKLGFGGTDNIESNRHNHLNLFNGSILAFKGKANLCEGFVIDNTGVIEIGKNFVSNKNFQISCKSMINIKDDFLAGWNVQMCAFKPHSVYTLPKPVNENKNLGITIGKHVWIGADAVIMPGTVIGNDSVVGMRSIVTKKFEQDNVLITGSPAVIKKTCINWEE